MFLKEIEYILTIAEEGSISKASEKLYVSQPSLSAYLSRMEKTLGTELFRRGKTQLHLTAVGKIYYEAARQIHEIQSQALAQMSDLQMEQESTLDIGVTGERGLRFFAGLLPSYYEKNPGIHITFHEKPVVDLQNLLKKGELDIALIAIGEGDPEIITQVVQHDEIVLALPRSHPLAHLGSLHSDEQLHQVSIHSFAKDSFVLLKEGTILRQNENSYFSENHFSPNVIVEAQGTFSSMTIVASGMAVGLCPKYFKYTHPNVAYVALENPLPYIIGLAYKKGKYLTRGMKSFIRMVKERGDEF